MGFGQSSSQAELLISGDAAAVSVTTTTTTAKAGASVLSGRQGLWLHNTSSTVAYWGPKNNPATTGIPLFKDEKVFFPAGETLTIYLQTASGSTTVRVIELAGAV